MVGGTITPATWGGGTAPATIGGTDNNITLGRTPIGGDGTFSGSATFAGGYTRDSGSWKGGFFGPSVAGNPQVHTSPSHAAGEFRVSRPEIRGGVNNAVTQNELHIRGAFGGARE